VVVDRGGEQPNCDELSLAEPWRLTFEARAELVE
jgi:ureidoglycolate lyase